jgi:hypothetical protein
MQYKVLSASLGRDDEIYKQGEYIEIESMKEAEELSSFGCILIVNAKEVEIVKEIETVKNVMEQPKTPDTGVVRAKKKGGNTK